METMKPTRRMSWIVINSKFLSSIKINRPKVEDSTLTGKIYFAPQAIALGLIDEIGSLDHAISLADSMANEEKHPINQSRNKKFRTDEDKNDLESDSKLFQKWTRPAWMPRN